GIERELAIEIGPGAGPGGHVHAIYLDGEQGRIGRGWANGIGTGLLRAEAPANRVERCCELLLVAGGEVLTLADALHGSGGGLAVVVGSPAAVRVCLARARVATVGRHLVEGVRRVARVGVRTKANHDGLDASLGELSHRLDGAGLVGATQLARSRTGG